MVKAANDQSGRVASPNERARATFPLLNTARASESADRKEGAI